MANKHGHDQGQTMMVSMDITADKYYVYSERGILINSVDYSIESNKYGDIVQVSNNGRNFIFAKPDDPSVIHILTMTQQGLKFVKTIKIRNRILKYA
jgi:hypothetical protein